jgi:hypothetical protein
MSFLGQEKHWADALLHGRLRSREMPWGGEWTRREQEAARRPEGETDPEDDDAPAEDPVQLPDVKHATTTRAEGARSDLGVRSEISAEPSSPAKGHPPSVELRCNRSLTGG